MINVNIKNLTLNLRHDCANFSSRIRLFAIIILMTTILSALSGPAFSQAEDPQARAIFEQAKALHDARGTERDLDAARTLYLKAADMGSSYACINLGYMYFTGEGVVKNYKTSRLWYKKAADRGNSEARRMMSVFYKNGLGVEADANTAQLWLERANGISPAPLPKPKIEKSATAAVTPAVKTPIITPAPAKKPAAKPAPQKPQPPKPVTKPAAKIAPQKTAPVQAPKSPQPEAKPKIKKPAAATPAPPVKTTDVAPVKLGAGTRWLALITTVCIALFGAITVIMARYRTVKDARDRQYFIADFYACHRNILKSSYIAAQDNKGVIISDSKDPWVKAALNLMTRFAQRHEATARKPVGLTRQVVRAVPAGPAGAEPILMPLMHGVEDSLIDDLNGQFNAGPKRAGAKELIFSMLRRRPAKPAAGISALSL